MKQENERREGDIPPHPVPRTAPAKPTGGHWGAAQANSPAGKQQVREPILQRPPRPSPKCCLSQGHTAHLVNGEANTGFSFY